MIQEWKCMVKTPSGRIQTMFVDAYDIEDATIAAESQTGGEAINVTPQFTSSDDAEYSSDFSGSGLLGLIIIGLCFYFWKWFLMIGAIGFILFLIYHFWDK